MDGGLFHPPDDQRNVPTESVVKAGRVVFFIPLLVMACAIGDCFRFPYNILAMVCVLGACGVVAWFWMRALRPKTDGVRPDAEAVGDSHAEASRKARNAHAALLWLLYLFVVFVAMVLVLIWSAERSGARSDGDGSGLKAGPDGR